MLFNILVFNRFLYNIVQSVAYMELIPKERNIQIHDLASGHNPVVQRSTAT